MSDRQKGLTLVEALVAIALLAVLVTFLVPYFFGKLQQAKMTRALGDLRAIEADLEVFQAEHGDLPDDLEAVDHADTLDPWGNAYRYLPFKGPGWKGRARKDRFLVPINSTYDLYSVGGDGDTRRPLTPPPSWDDVIRANNGHFLGLASEY